MTAEFKMTLDVCKKTIDELEKMTSFDLVTIQHKRRPAYLPENYFSFLKYRAGTILEKREDRFEAKRRYKARVAHRSMVRAVRKVVRYVPDIMQERGMRDALSSFLKEEV